MHHLVCKTAVVRQKEDPRRVAIQPSDRKNSLIQADAVFYRGPPLLVVKRCYTVFRFIEDDVEGFVQPDNLFPMDCYSIVRGIELRSKVQHYLVIYANLTIRNQLIRFSAGTDAGAGKEFVQT